MQKPRPVPDHWTDAQQLISEVLLSSADGQTPSVTYDFGSNKDMAHQVITGLEKLFKTTLSVQSGPHGVPRIVVSFQLVDTPSPAMRGDNVVMAFYTQTPPHRHLGLPDIPSFVPSTSPTPSIRAVPVEQDLLDSFCECAANHALSAPHEAEMFGISLYGDIARAYRLAFHLRELGLSTALTLPSEREAQLWILFSQRALSHEPPTPPPGVRVLLPFNDVEPNH